jgi:hypothetical protein
MDTSPFIVLMSYLFLVSSIAERVAEGITTHLDRGKYNPST